MSNREIQKRLKQRCSDKTFEHTLRVSELAVELAECHGVDAQKAETAALLHDVTKDLSTEEHLALLEAAGTYLDPVALDLPAHLHAYSGEVVARQEFGIEDPDILSAIRNHSLGRPSMTKLEKVVHLADVLEPGRPNTPTNQKSRQLARNDLDEALLVLLPICLAYQIRKDDIEDRILQQFDYLIEQKIREKHGAKAPETNPFDAIEEEYFQESTEQFKLHSIDFEGIINARDLGGYPCTDGRKVRPGMLIRSGAPSDATQEDANLLHGKTQVSHLIDLQFPDEYASPLSEELTGYTYVNAPLGGTLHSVAADDFALQGRAAAGKEQAWFYSQFSRSYDMPSMYRDFSDANLFGPTFRRIVATLESDECTGALIYCSQGKDRTGVVVAALLTLLGCDEDTVFADYRMSEFALLLLSFSAELLLEESGYGAEAQKLMHGVLAVNVENLTRFFEGIYAKYESFDGFLRAMDISPEQVSRLRAKYSA